MIKKKIKKHEYFEIAINWCQNTIKNKVDRGGRRKTFRDQKI